MTERDTRTFTAFFLDDQNLVDLYQSLEAAAAALRERARALHLSAIGLNGRWPEDSERPKNLGVVNGVQLTHDEIFKIARETTMRADKADDLLKDFKLRKLNLPEHLGYTTWDKDTHVCTVDEKPPA